MIRHTCNLRPHRVLPEGLALRILTEAHVEELHSNRCELLGLSCGERSTARCHCGRGLGLELTD